MELEQRQQGWCGVGVLFFASLSPSAMQHVATINDSAFADRWGVGFGPPRLTDVRAQAYVTGISVYFEYIFFSLDQRNTILFEKYVYLVFLGRSIYLVVYGVLYVDLYSRSMPTKV